jgi:hypothetical protein
MVGGPVWRELYMSHYPARPEAFALPLVAAAMGAAVAVGGWLAGGLLGTVAFGGLLFIFADLQLDLERWTYTAVVAGGCVGLALVFVKHRAAICALALGTFYVSSLLRPSIAPPPARLSATGAARSNALLVHIILDEQWGVGGLRAAGDSATAAFLTDFYLKRGFELYESAYSRYLLSAESIPGTLSLGQTLESRVRRPAPYWHRMARIPYFERLHELQYDIRVYQSTFLDFCSNGDVAVASCEVQAGNSIRNFGFFEGSWVTRGLSAGRFFLNTRSHVYDRLNPESTVWHRSVAGGGLAAMQRLTDAIAAGENDRSAFFVHVLLPHRPVQVDAECRILSEPAEYTGYDLLEYPGDSLWREALRAYGEQVRCAHRALARVIDAIDSTAGRDQSIVIVHGDHGSRMHPHAPVRDALEAYTADELNSNFSTLLAVRLPNVTAAVYPEAIPVQDAIWELARSNFVGPLQKTWQHYLRKMPESSRTRGVERSLAASDMLWARQPY